MIKRTQLSLLPSLLVAMAATATAQEWYPELQSVSPPARRFHAMAHVGGYNVLFGGINEQSGVVFNDTWTYDGLSWTQSTANGPGARQRFASCVDRTRNVLIVFGGEDANGQPLSDTWEFDGTHWSQAATASLVTPSPRLGAAMAFDEARGVVVLFGGGATGTTPTDETWQFDGTNWRQLGLTTMPPARQGHTMTHDAARGRTILFGGFEPGIGSFGSDTWEWDGATWQQIVTATVPATAIFPSMTFFEPHGIAVMTGSNGVASQPVRTWIFDGMDWSAGPTAPAALGGRQAQAITFDPIREMVVLFGGARIGFGGASPLQDTWELSTQATFDSFGTGCSLGSATPELTAVANSRPQIGSALRLEVSPAGSQVLFVAGLSDATYPGGSLPLDLSLLGMPGCELLTSIDFTSWQTPVADRATTAIAIPLRRDLIGQQFFAQALVVAPPSGTGIVGAMSNGGRATIGN